jgi:hypothetical protein
MFEENDDGFSDALASFFDTEVWVRQVLGDESIELLVGLWRVVFP